MELMQQLNLQQHMLRMIRMHVDGTKASIETEKRVLDSLIKKDQKKESKYNKKRKELEQELAELNDAIGRVTLQILEKEFAVIAEREIQDFTKWCKERKEMEKRKINQLVAQFGEKQLERDRNNDNRQLLEYQASSFMEELDISSNHLEDLEMLRRTTSNRQAVNPTAKEDLSNLAAKYEREIEDIERKMRRVVFQRSTVYTQAYAGQLAEIIRNRAVMLMNKFDSKASAARAEVLGIAVIDAVDCDIGCVGKDPTEMYYFPCNHRKYCIQCMNAWLQASLENMQQFPPKCDNLGCEFVSSKDIAYNFLEGEQFIKYQKFWSEYIDKGNFVYCPKCGDAALKPMDTEPDVECMNCHIMFCIQCKSLWHAGYTCEQFQALPEDERTPEGRATLKALREGDYKPCPQCGVYVHKIQGCNYVYCIMCRTAMCWQTGKKRSECGGGHNCH